MGMLLQMENLQGERRGHNKGSAREARAKLGQSAWPADEIEQSQCENCFLYLV